MKLVMLFEPQVYLVQAPVFLFDPLVYLIQPPIVVIQTAGLNGHDFRSP
jgi:hypothetical protein